MDPDVPGVLCLSAFLTALIISAPGFQLLAPEFRLETPGSHWDSKSPGCPFSAMQLPPYDHH
jgi:hypothetical protein